MPVAPQHDGPDLTAAPVGSTATAPDDDRRTALTEPAAQEKAPTARPVTGRSSVAADVALIATFAAFIAVCGLLPSLTVPGIVVPITLQTFGVMLAGVVLGARRGALAVLLYLAVGLAGVPVFAQGTGGLAVLAKPSIGYLLAFPLAAALAGFLVTRARNLPWRVLPLAIFGSAMAGSLVFTHPIGIAVMGAKLGMTAQEAITTGATFLPGDVVKNVLVTLVASAVFRAFPDMLTGRR